MGYSDRQGGWIRSHESPLPFDDIDQGWLPDPNEKGIRIGPFELAKEEKGGGPAHLHPAIFRE